MSQFYTFFSFQLLISQSTNLESDCQIHYKFPFLVALNGMVRDIGGLDKTIWTETGKELTIKEMRALGGKR